MNEKPKVKFKWLEKLKNIKHIEIIVVVIFIIVILLIYMSSFSSKSKSSNTKVESKQLTITSYVDNLESELENTILNIKGVSKAKVMVTLDMNGATIDENIINSTTFPEIKGVVVVAKGVEDTSVKLNVLKAIEALIDIKTGRIEILNSN